MYSHASSCVHMSLPVFERSWICTWLFLAVLGCTWLYLAVPGCTWLYLTVHGCTWLYLAMAMVCLGLFQITIWRVDGWMELWMLVLIKPNIHWTGIFFLISLLSCTQACISRQQAYPCPWQEEKCIFNLTSYQLKLLSRWTHFAKVKYEPRCQHKLKENDIWQITMCEFVSPTYRSCKKYSYIWFYGIECSGPI